MEINKKKKTKKMYLRNSIIMKRVWKIYTSILKKNHEKGRDRHNSYWRTNNVYVFGLMLSHGCRSSSWAKTKMEKVT